jgi:hypothetical protein
MYRLFFSHGGDDTYVVHHFLKPKLEDTGATVFLDEEAVLHFMKALELDPKYKIAMEALTDVRRAMRIRGAA